MKAKIPLLFFLLLSHINLALAAESRPWDDCLAEAFEHGKIKGQLRYSAQYRDSSLHVLQDSSTPDIEIADEKKQQYSAIGGYLGV